MFARELIREHILIDSPARVLNPVLEFSRYLTLRGIDSKESAEFAERNRKNLILEINTLCGEWEKLGLDMPLCISESRVITWIHPSFMDHSDFPPITREFTQILSAVRGAAPRDFLGIMACYLVSIGCTKVFITDTSGDCGIDLIASFGSGELGQVCLFVQAKTSTGIATKKEALLADFSKFLLLKRLPKWNTYIKACELDRSISGLSTIFAFTTNAEFREGIRESALGLEVMLKSGRQIAASISKKFTSEQFERAVSSLRPYIVSLSINVADKIFRSITDE